MGLVCRLAVLMLAIISLLSSARAQDVSAQIARGMFTVSNCGNANIACRPLYGLYRPGSVESKQLDAAYDEAIRLSDNKLSVLFKGTLPTAINELRQSGQSDKFPFWILALNTSSTKQSVTFYLRRSNAPVNLDNVPDTTLNYVNCLYLRSLCWQPTPLDIQQAQINAATIGIDSNPANAFEKIMNQLKDGQLVAASTLDLEPGEVKVRGLGFGNLDDTYAIALLTAAAADRVVFDPRDVLRVGVSP